ncbi:serine threonine-protein kinase hal4 sat4, partial [Chlamydoabsidia padenii]
EFYAVKIFKKVKRTEHHGKYMKRLISEYCIASSINHPNIVKTWDLITDVSNRYCIVMEFCSGGDLYHAIKKNRVTWTKMNSYFKQLLLGLDYLHSLGVAHRDIKPENLLLSGDGSILKITDFGVADVFCETWQRHSRLSDGFCGSLAFIAPEVDLGYQGSKVDVWSAAIVYCCMYFKGTIFASAQSSDPYYRAYLNTFYSRSFVPFAPLEDSKMSSVLYQMLDPDPDRRLSASQLLSIPFISNI